MRVGLAQIDGRVGDLANNCRRILAAVDAAQRQGAELVVLPELATTGYPPRDLLLDPVFVDHAEAATADLARDLAAGPPVVLGTIARAPSATPGHPGLWNAAVLLRGGTIEALAGKRLLPTYDVFFETRWFVPGEAPEPASVVAVAGRRLGLLVCEDLWDEGYPVHPPADLVAAGADLLVVPSASPYRTGIEAQRHHHARHAGAAVVYVNAAGANDELIFDGGSFVLDGGGRLVARLPRFEEAVEVVDLGALPTALRRAEPKPPHGEDLAEELFSALVLGVRGFAAKNGLHRLFLGLSGGIDSALVAGIAAAAVGPAAVTALALPGRYTDPRSTAAARALAGTLGIGFSEIPIEPLHEATARTLAPLLDGSEQAAATDENLQARLRALLLLAHVNRHGGLLLNTSNKTELSLGYGTLNGDLAGTLSPLGDLTKPQVQTVARWFSAHRAPIPAFVLERPPSAELRPDQVDPFDYAVVSPAIEALVLGHAPPEGLAAADLDRYRRLLRTAEHKRLQHGIVLKVSERAFGSGRMMPVTRAV